jgi:hypothetical protein
VADELLPPEEQQGDQEHLGPSFEYPPVGEMPPVQQQPQSQSAPSKTSFRDSARRLGRLNAAVDRYGSPRDKEYAVKDKDIQKVAGADGAKDKAKEAGKLARDLPGKSIDATKANLKNRASNASGLLKNKKLLGGIFGSLGVIAPFIFFIFWLMLFKNVHMKNLFITASFAKFDSSVSRTLKEALEESGSKAEGSVDSTIDPNGSIEEIVGQTDAKVKDIDTKNPETLREKAIETRAADTSADGSFQKTRTDLGVDANIDPPEGKTEAELQKDAKAKAEAEVKGDAEVKDLPDGLKEEGAKTEEGIKEGKTPKAAAEGAAEGSSFAKGFSNAINPFIAITFYCIFRDIWVSGKEAFNKALVAGAVRTTNEVAKTADCQKVGECSPAQIAAVSNMADDGEDSFSNSCAAKYAGDENTAGCVPIDSNYIINHLPDGYAGAGSFVNAVLDPSTAPGVGPILGPTVGPICKAVLNPVVQGVVATGSLVAVYAAASSAAAAAAAKGGPEASAAAAAGTTAVLTALGKGLVAVLGTSAGKALFVSTALHYGGHQFEDMVPSTFGNVMGMGSKAMATDMCRQYGCPAITQEQSSDLTMQVRQEKIARLERKSVWYRMFSPENEDSVTVKVALRTPTSPSAIMGRIGRIFGSITNPTMLTSFAGNTAMAFVSPSHAEAASTDLYGIAERAPILRWSLPENENWVEDQDSAKLDALKTRFEESTSGSIADTLDAENNQVNKTSSACDDQDDIDMQHYCQHRFQKHIVFMFGIAQNNQSNVPNSSGGGATTATANTPGPIFLTGDSITEGLITGGGIQKKLEDAQFKPVTYDASSSRAFNEPGRTTAAGTKTTGYAALALPDNIKAIQGSEYVFVGLGTNPAGPLPANYAGDISKTIDTIKGIKSSVKIYWMNIFSPVIISRPERNLILTAQASAKGFTVIDANSISDKIEYDNLSLHPKNGANYAILADFVVQKLGEGGVAASGNSKELAQKLLDSPQVSFTTTEAEDAIKAVASGKKANVTCLRGATTDINATLLSGLLKTTEKYSIGLGYFTNGCHTGDSAHYSGRAIDIGTVNGQQVDGNDKLSWDYLSELSNYLPDGSTYGQKQCGVNSTNVRLVHKITFINDICTHLHIQVPK